MAGNIAFREQITRQCRTDRAFRKIVWTMCARDLLYYVNTFVWGYDPRKIAPGESPIEPFITWPKQDEWLYTLTASLGHTPVIVKKPRDMGWSWLVLLLFKHRWHFGSDRTSFLCVSRKEDLVDGDEDSLFSKIDFILEHEPGWLRPPYNRRQLKFINTKTRSNIEGFSTTSGSGVGGRRTGIFNDEWGLVREAYEIRDKTRDVCPKGRIFISTPYPEGVCFQDMWDKAGREGGMLRIEPHWSDRPERMEGAYKDAEGTLRSPWLDKEEKEREPRDFQTNVLAEFFGAGTSFYSGDVLKKMQADCMSPFMVGQLEFDWLSCDPLRFEENSAGGWHLWMHLDNGRVVPGRQYVVGVDIATGTGASNSVIAVGDVITGEKVLEYANSRVSPRHWAKMAVATARFFNEALLIWEANGPGRDFGKAVEEQGYGNIFFRRNEAKFGRDSTDFPGWWSDENTKPALLGGHREAVWTGRYVERSAVCVEECKTYIYANNGELVNARSLNTLDPSGARHQHADRTIASALIVRGLEEFGAAQTQEPDMIPGTVGWRRRERDRKKKREGDNDWAVGEIWEPVAVEW